MDGQKDTFQQQSIARVKTKALSFLLVMRLNTVNSNKYNTAKYIF